MLIESNTFYSDVLSNTSWSAPASKVLCAVLYSKTCCLLSETPAPQQQLSTSNCFVLSNKLHITALTR
jgi:hypothetical protein